MRWPAITLLLGLGASCSAGNLGEFNDPDASAPTPTPARDGGTTTPTPARDGGTTTPPRDAATDVTPAPAPSVTGTQLMPAIPQHSARDTAPIAPREGVLAFPGAEGFGARSTGGRGGRVIYVTTLNPTGPGSLGEALAAQGRRTILFKVSGLIDGSFTLLNGEVTIAGQSSPGGVIVRGLATGETPWCDSNCGANVRGVDNVVIRHLRTRPGNPGSNGLIDGDGLRIRHARHVMIDHVSSENAVDESMEISYSNNVTVQDSILGETIGGHSDRGGMLVNYSNPAAGYQLDNLAVIRTAWVRIQGRYPELARESRAAAGSTFHVELANNLLWDQKYYIDSGHYAGNQGEQFGPAYYEVNWVGNLGVARPNFPYGMFWFQNPSGRSTVYFRDNHLTSMQARTDWQLVYCCNDFRTSPAPTRPSWAMDRRHDFPAVTYLESDEVRRYVVAHAGAFPRDPMDRRLMGYVAAGRAPDGAVNSNPAGDAWRTDWTAATAPRPPVDGDSDGMPDDWEREHGLDPAVQDHNGQSVGQTMDGLAGYTNLEVYLHELALKRLTEGPWGR